jgi:hypothetical protein
MLVCYALNSRTCPVCEVFNAERTLGISGRNVSSLLSFAFNTTITSSYFKTPKPQKPALVMFKEQAS